MKKRLLALLLALALLISAGPFALAAGDTITVYFTACQDAAIMRASDGTSLAHVAVSVMDGATIDDVFRAVNDAYCPGGYTTEESQYGLTITKFLGVESMNVGYYNNDAFCMGVTDPVAAGDHVVFWFYKDTTNWSDTYTHFSSTTAGVAAGHSKTFTLTTWDGKPVVGATLLLNGAATEFVTDGSGQATVPFANKGVYTVSAEANAVIVPPVCVVTVGTFSDTTESTAEAIDWAVARGIVKGYPDGSFRPDTPVTRGEFAAMLYREAVARNRKDVTVGEDTNILGYKDAFTLPEWVIPHLQWACGAGVLKGRSGYLAPNDYVTREEAALMLYRFAGSPAVEGAMGMAGYEDVQTISVWAGTAMQWAVLSGVLSGRDGGEGHGAVLAPQSPATRAELVTMLSRMK